MIGEKFGKWTVLSETISQAHDRKYECKCDCGSVKSIYGCHLKSGRSKSCGCSKSEGLEPVVKGKRFGRLVVVGMHAHSRAHCVCDCGNECYPGRYNLRNGTAKSCGCYKRDRTSEVHRKHGESHKHPSPSTEYTAWASMRRRVN